MSNKSMTMNANEALVLGLPKELITGYLDGSVSVDADARKSGGTYAATTYSDSIPTTSGGAVSDKFYIYDVKSKNARIPNLIYFLASVDTTIVLLDTPQVGFSAATNIDTSAKVDALIATTTGKIIHYPKVTAGITSTRITDASFSGIEPFAVQRFAIKSNTASASLIAFKANKDAEIILVAKT